MKGSMILKNKGMGISLACITASSLFMFLTVFFDYDSEGLSKILSPLIAIGFWISLLIGYIFFFITHRKSGVEKVRKTPGVVCFFSNSYAFVCDLVMIVAFVAIIVILITGFANAIINTALISILFLTINLHCILNGRVFNKCISRNHKVRGMENE